jgi:hypothetical protein
MWRIIYQKPITFTGTQPGAMPSLPPTLHPQHFTLPEVVTAQVCLPPDEIEVTLLVRPTTSTGVCLSVVTPSPS